MIDLWFLDCYCPAALGGEDFPVNSYYTEDLDAALEAAKRLLTSAEISGITSVRIGMNCKKGQSPILLKEQT